MSFPSARLSRSWSAERTLRISSASFIGFFLLGLTHDRPTVIAFCSLQQDCHFTRSSSIIVSTLVPIIVLVRRRRFVLAVAQNSAEGIELLEHPHLLTENITETLMRKLGCG